MSDEQKTEKDLNDILNGIDEKIGEKVGEEITKGFEKMASRIEKDKSREEEKVDDFNFFDNYEDDDDRNIRKKDLENFGRTLAVSIIKETTKLIKDEIKSEFDTRTTKGSRDSQAFDEFPEMARKSKVYNKKFEDAVNEEMAQRISRGRKDNDPDLLYDCAAAVNSRWIAEGKKVPEHVRREEERQQRNSMDNYGGGGGSANGREQNSKPGKLTDYQKNFLPKIRMNPEKMAKLNEKYRFF